MTGNLKIKVPDAVIETSRDGVLRYDAAMGENVGRNTCKIKYT